MTGVVPPRFKKGGRANVKKMEKGPNGRCLCRQCNTEVPVGRKTFCSNDCVHTWRLSTDGGYLRECVMKRDKGVCSSCGCDTELLRRQLNALKRSNWLAWHQWMVENKAAHRKYMWDAHHVIPVEHGGGCSGLENLVTLCLKCHKAVSAKDTRKRNSKNGSKKPKGLT